MEWDNVIQSNKLDTQPMNCSPRQAELNHLGSLTRPLWSVSLLGILFTTLSGQNHRESFKSSGSREYEAGHESERGGERFLFVSPCFRNSLSPSLLSQQFGHTIFLHIFHFYFPYYNLSKIVWLYKCSILLFLIKLNDIKNMEPPPAASCENVRTMNKFSFLSTNGSVGDPGPRRWD